MIRLEQYVQKGSAKLRMGYTTGTCAAGAARAAAETLLSGQPVVVLKVRTPAGIAVELEVEELLQLPGSVLCGIRKDAGDDPDVTDGLMIRVEVCRQTEGFTVRGGVGVGTVTSPGLAVQMGEPAINPVPWQMIQKELEEASCAHGYDGGFCVTISVPGGAEVAEHTFNPRLGIKGGISILGTSGMVEPMSEPALLESIRLEIRQKRACGAEVLLLTPGNYGRDFALQNYRIDLDTGVKCSNFIGEALDCAQNEGFRQIMLMGHAGKLVKLAGGIFNTHSRVADCRMEIITAHAALCGVQKERLRQLMECVSTDAADALLMDWDVAGQVWQAISGRVHAALKRRVRPDCRVEFISFGQRGQLMQSSGWESLLPAIKEWKQ